MKTLFFFHGAALSSVPASRVHARHSVLPALEKTTKQRHGIGRRALSMKNQGPLENAPPEVEESLQKAGVDTIAQYVVIRKDLVEALKWPLGSVLAQACHAAVAAVWSFRDHPHTLEYCGNLDSMTTVTLEVKGETQLMNLAEKLRENDISYKLWIEQPENFPTCLATKPYPKSEVAEHFKKLRLCK